MANARRSFQDRPRRKRQWIRKSTSPTEILNGVASTLLELSAADYTGQGFGNPTVVRIRGTIVVSPDPATFNAQTESQRMGFGIISLREGATAGVVSPASDPNESWMFWRTRTYTLQDDGTGGLDLAGVGVNEIFDFDVKAMRILRGRDEIAFIVENVGDSDAHMFVSVAWSVLLQE